MPNARTHLAQERRFDRSAWDTTAPRQPTQSDTETGQIRFRHDDDTPKTETHGDTRFSADCCR
jgi:hypothetical protein